MPIPYLLYFIYVTVCLIMPLSLVQAEEDVLSDQETTEPLQEIKLLPHVRVESLAKDKPPVIMAQALQPFLSRPRVVSQDELDASSRIVSLVKDHVEAGVGDEFYASAPESDEDVLKQGKQFEIVRLGKEYIDPDSDDTLGYEAIYLGDAEVVRSGNPAKLVLTTTKQEVLLDDRVIPITDDQSIKDFVPVPASTSIEGKIIEVLGGVSQVGKYSAVVLNKGTFDGLKFGHALKIFQRSSSPIGLRMGGDTPELPLEPVGNLVIFRTFERVSYAVVMRASMPIAVGNSVKGFATAKTIHGGNEYQ